VCERERLRERERERDREREDLVIANKDRHKVLGFERVAPSHLYEHKKIPKNIYD